MKLEDMLNQQAKRGMKQHKIKAKMQSYDDYIKDDASPRPYNTPNVVDLNIDSRSNKDPLNTAKSAQDVIQLSDSRKKSGAKVLKDTPSANNINQIRDTSTAMDSELIGDTSALDDTDHIRDTNSSLSSAPIRDTGEALDPEPIGDTSVLDDTDHIRDTKKYLIIDTSLLKAGHNNQLENNKYIDLIGNAKKIVDEIANICLITGVLDTYYIDKQLFSKNTGVKVGAIKTTVCRLKAKGILIKYEASKGRNSSWKFSLHPAIFEQYLTSRRGS